MSGGVAIVAPGQGSQRAAMLRGVPQATSLDHLLDAAEGLSGRELRAIAEDGSAADLADTRVAQPLLYLTDWAWATALVAAGVRPVAVAGHSLGELAALAVAGVYSVEAGLELVVERARLMADCAALVPGGMMAVLGLDSAVVAEAVSGLSHVWLANDNTVGQVVLSGTHAGLESAHHALSEAGARRLVKLPVAGPFHSPLMEPAADAFAALLEKAAFNDARIPVVQNVEPTPATGGSVIRERLSRQIVAPVRWTETMIALRDMGASTLIEAGPGAVLAGLAKRIEGVRGLAVETAGLDAIVEEVAGSR